MDVTAGERSWYITLLQLYMLRDGQGLAAVC